MAKKEKLSQQALLEILTKEIEKLHKSKDYIGNSMLNIEEYMENINEYSKTLEKERRRIHEAGLDINTEELEKIFNTKINELKQTIEKTKGVPQGAFNFMVFLALWAGGATIWLILIYFT